MLYIKNLCLHAVFIIFGNSADASSYQSQNHLLVYRNPSLRTPSLYVSFRSTHTRKSLIKSLLEYLVLLAVLWFKYVFYHWLDYFLLHKLQLFNYLLVCNVERPLLEYHHLSTCILELHSLAQQSKNYFWITNNMNCAYDAYLTKR